MQDSWFTRRTRWSSYHTRMIHHESWGSHTPTVLQNLHKRDTYDHLKHRLSPATKPKVALLATRFVRPHSWSQPTKITTFSHQQAEKSPQNQHVLSYNPLIPITRALATHGEENKNRRSRRICGFIVREGGVEPPLHHWNTDLNRARLPIPPLARTQKE